MKSFGEFSAVVVALVVATLFMFGEAYIINDIFHLYKVPVFSELSIIHIWVLLIVWATLRARKDEKKDETVSEKLAQFWSKLFDKTLEFLFIWGFVYFIHRFFL